MNASHRGHPDDGLSPATRRRLRFGATQMVASAISVGTAAILGLLWHEATDANAQLHQLKQQQAQRPYLGPRLDRLSDALRRCSLAPTSRPQPPQ